MAVTHLGLLAVTREDHQVALVGLEAGYVGLPGTTGGGTGGGTSGRQASMATLVEKPTHLC